MAKAKSNAPAGILWGRLALVTLAGALLLYVTIAATFNLVMAQQQNVAYAEVLWPSSAAAAKMAEAELVSIASTNDTSRAGNIKKHAAAVLRRDPVNVIAARVAGIASAMTGDSAQGTRLLAYAESLSRRDLGTQVALIEAAVSRGDIGTALRHYDTALRTGDNSDQLLLPVLVAASRDPAIAAKLEPMLSRQPPWRLRFIYSLITAQPWGSTFFPLVKAARLNVNNDVERDFLSRAVTGLVAMSKLGDAVALYEQAVGKFPADGIRNGSFIDEDRIPPFDWNIVDEPGLGGVKGAIDGTSVPGALSLSAEPGRSGAVAKQLLMLPPGQHRIRFVVGNVSEADRSGVLLSCNGTDLPIANVRLPRTAPSRSRVVEMSGDIPANCPGQWLIVQASTDIDAPREFDDPWISQMTVER